jgi:hypothetical protein
VWRTDSVGLTADKAIALGALKPLHCSLFHFVTYFYFEFLLSRIAAGEEADAMRNQLSTAGESNLADTTSVSDAGKSIHSVINPEDALVVSQRR